MGNIFYSEMNKYKLTGRLNLEGIREGGEGVVGIADMATKHSAYGLDSVWGNKKSWAELCQALKKLGLAKPALPGKKLRWSSMYKDIFFHLP